MAVSGGDAQRERDGPAAALTRSLSAALLAGFGGLAFELAALRRAGLLLGNTAEASSAVVGLFLLGLGIGGFVASRKARAVGGAAFLGRAYGMVALAVLAGISGLGLADPPGPVVGAVVLTFCVLGPAIAMGFAFPLLFAFAPRVPPGLVLAANLVGSVGAAFLAGNFLIPGVGIVATAWIAAGCYAVTALAVRGAPAALPAGSAEVEDAPVGLTRLAAALAVSSGLLTVGFEILLFRRLPFFLEGFQPTASGVLAACLLALSLGSALTIRIAKPGTGSVVAGRALIAGAVVASLGIHEWTGPGLARFPVGSDLGLHGRVLFGALVAAVPLIPLGVVVPALLVDVRPDVRARAAGLLFLWQGVGSLAGSLALGQALPRFASEAFFVLAGPVAALLALLVAAIGGRADRRPVFATVLLVVASLVSGAGGAGSPWSPTPPVRGSRYDRPDAYAPIAHRTDSITTASVVYDRAHHSTVLFTDEFRAAYTGPGTSYMQVLGHLPFLLRDGLEDVAVLALGTGTTAEAVRVWPSPDRIHVVEISRAVFELCDRFAGDGPAAEVRPAPFRVDPRTEVHLTDGRRWLATREPDSLDLLTMEPLLPYAPGTAPLYSAEFYRAVRACLRSGGICVQWVPTHAMPRPMFETLLGTFRDAFDHTSVWLVDQSTLLVGSKSLPHLPSQETLRARLDAAPAAARRTLHEAGIAAVDDLAAACLLPAAPALFPEARRLVDDRPFLERIGYWSGAERLSFYPENLGALREVVRAAGSAEDPLGGSAAMRTTRLAGLAARASVLLEPEQAALAVARAAEARAALPGSTLLHGEETLALRALTLVRARTDSAEAVRASARRLAERDPGSAEIMVLASGDARGVARALAVDPTVADRSGWAFEVAGVDLPSTAGVGPLETVSSIPEGEGLVDAAAADDALGAALRAAYRVRVGRAMVQELARRPLDRPGEAWAFAQVLDPALFEAAAAVTLDARGGLAMLEELSPVWRRDLPLPAAFGVLAAAEDAAIRRRFVEGIEGRRGPRAADALASLALDPDRDVRVAASAAAFRAFGAAAAFDPDAPESERQRAADRLRSLHNRRP